MFAPAGFLLQSDESLALTQPPTIQVLPNGVTVIAQRLPGATVNFSLWVGCGSQHETDDQNGMAHFLEHMVFKGNDRIPLGHFEQRVERVGGMTNAATSQEYTHFFVTTAPQDFPDVAPLLVDLVLRPGLAAEEFDRERQVVLEEIRRAQDMPQRRLMQRVLSLGFAGLPYARPVLGPAEVVAQLTPEAMRRFHQQWYSPERLTAVVVGDLAVENLLEVVVPCLTPWRTHDPAPQCVFPTPVCPLVHDEEMVDDVEQARLVLSWPVPGLRDFQTVCALDALAMVLGQGRTSRLVWELRYERGWVTGITVQNMSFVHQGLFWIGVQAPVQHIPAVTEVIREHLARLATELICPEELALLRRRVTSRFIFANETPAERAGLYGYYQTVLGDISLGLGYPGTVASLQASVLQQVAQTYLVPERMSRVVMRPRA
ncbi:MAG: pitrilysin family protein [Gloeomargarita sp. SKYBB_i_bin120]|nr:insulinase family protein [Gloeomargarita sp. SKYB120]MDW8178473.1 pitrilysin family protein [Gloeomargarita sp. SKYBB_i_bin120]